MIRRMDAFHLGILLEDIRRGNNVYPENNLAWIEWLKGVPKGHVIGKMDNTIAFTLCEDRNPKIELYGDKNKSAEVVVDYISQVLQDNGYENASKYIDAMFEL